MSPLTTLRGALDALAEAMASGDPDLVLAQEYAVASAAAALARVSVPDDAGARAALRAELVTARAALDRCRQLGTASSELLAAMFAPASGYAASGAVAPSRGPSPRFSSLS